MLIALDIRDLVLVERVSLDFGPGLQVLTGETGAGKSILLDALGLAVGGRADAALVRPGAERARVTASFAAPPPEHPVRRLLREAEIDSDGDLLLGRTVGTDGRSRATVNDQPVAVGLLRRVGAQLVEIHGQFEQHGLLDPATHGAMLDAFAGLTGSVTALADRFTAWRDQARLLAKTESAAAARAAHARTLADDLDTLDRLAPIDGEEATLVSRRTALQHRERGLEVLGQAAELLGGHDGADARVAGALRALGRLPGGGTVLDAATTAALDRAADEIADTLRAIERAVAALGDGADTLDRIDDRLHALRAAARRHGVTVDALPTLAARLREELDAILGAGERLPHLTAATATARAAYLADAERLRQARQAAARTLADRIARELAPLKMDKARFEVAVEPLAEDAARPDGLDRIEFKVATLPGAPTQPLARVLSGGELNRVMLALQVVLAGSGDQSTLVFDEVDAGVGGATADAVGARLAELGRVVQVLAVTHSPQVAARADGHHRVVKRGDGERPRAEVDRLDDAQRREEIARMLSGATVTDEARAQAARLIGAPA
jgi:DNA repair protein RecN (Recombination protein N)